MNIQLWIVGQIAIDALLVGILLWLIVAGNRRRARDTEAQNETLRKSEEILSDMRDITRELEGNLEEKRELTRRLLGRLDETLERAGRRYDQLNELFEKTESVSDRDPVFPKEASGTHASIRSLLDKGLSKEEVARHLGVSVGEIELFLKLGSHTAHP
jgi:methyl-accepting chemotaxis protein